ncbi:MAG: bifunctional diaminohydroxyphosphoribosylaminopyrimidine deaminase/5-amino-6-(5-phosphoribosylamino)uracil reductase RibD [Sphingobacteriales bacterium]|nr:bifunctional diaminohydroxyphosphoribosylaminopyrimidine deaminase/5-amino-6-(5-phosphoribosylamino)uracil reductase RibD [Sphingobacteriales bacterium]
MLKYIQEDNSMTDFSTYHEKYMHRCFQLAKAGESYVAPNPMVGAVLVYEDRIIGEGYHQEYGKAHAEVNCLHSVKEADHHLIGKSTLYVSLEPCSHFGKTPPCTDLIIRHKIPKVVIAVQDIFSEVNGKGIQRLKENNIEVVTGILEKEGKELIRQFLYFHSHKMPFVTLKFAQSKDGYIGIKGKEIAISGILSKRYTHQLRAAHQAVLVGKNTVLTDNPQLTLRHWTGKNPVRIVLAHQDDIPADYNVWNKEAETLFLSGSIKDVLHSLAEKNIVSVLVEGGADVLRQFMESNSWNEAHIITSNESIPRTADDIPIASPCIQGIAEKTLYAETDTVQILKNPDAPFAA